MNQHFELLFQYLTAVRRYPWTTFLTAATVMVLGWIFIVLLPNVYESKATLYINSKATEPLLDGLSVDSQRTQTTAMLMQHLLLSRANLLDMLEHDNPGFKLTDERSREQVIRNLMQDVWISGDPKTSLYGIRYRDTDPQRAYRVVETIMQRFLARSSNDTISDSKAMQAFLASEKDRYWALLDEERKTLEAFRQRNRSVLPAKGQSFYSELDTARQKLHKARLDLEESRRRVEALESQRKRSGVSKSYRGITINDELARLERELKKIRLRFTEFHPDAVALQEEIEDLRSRKRRLGGNYLLKPFKGQAPGIAGNTRQSLDVAIASAKGDVQALEVRVKSFEGRVAELEDKVDIVPKIESELVIIEKRYQALQKTYDDIVRRYEAAMITTEADSNEDIAKIKVIEHPIVPLLPVAPKRLKLLIATGLLGLVAGIGVAAFRARQKQVVSTVKELRRRSEVPILGAVSLFETDEMVASKRTERIRLVMAWGLLGLTALAFLYLARQVG